MNVLVPCAANLVSSHLPRPLPESPLQTWQGVRAGREQHPHVCVPGPHQLPCPHWRVREGKGRVALGPAEQRVQPQNLCYGVQWGSCRLRSPLAGSSHSRAVQRVRVEALSDTGSPQQPALSGSNLSASLHTSVPSCTETGNLSTWDSYAELRAQTWALGSDRRLAPDVISTLVHCKVLAELLNISRSQFFSCLKRMRTVINYQGCSDDLQDNACYVPRTH